MGVIDKIGHAVKDVFEFYKDRWTDPTIGPRLEVQRDKFKESWATAGTQAIDTVFLDILGNTFPLIRSVLPSKRLTAKQRGQMFFGSLGEMIGSATVLVSRVLLASGRTAWVGGRHAVGY